VNTHTHNKIFVLLPVIIIIITSNTRRLKPRWPQEMVVERPHIVAADSSYDAYDGEDVEQSGLHKAAQWLFTAVMVALLVAVGVDLVTTQYLEEWIKEAVEIMKAYNASLSAFMLIGITIIAVVINFPATFLAGCAGYLMAYKLGFMKGILTGTLINIVGYVIGASVCYVLALTAFKAWIMEQTQKSMIMRRVGLAIGKKDFEMNCLIRMSPIVPAVLINYGLPCLGSEFVPYFWGCFIGTLPYSLTFAIFGALASSGGDLDSLDLPTWLNDLFMVVGVLIVAAVLGLGYKYSNEALQETLESQNGPKPNGFDPNMWDTEAFIPNETDSLLRSNIVYNGYAARTQKKEDQSSRITI
jgi:uncharacterized membrane protein YdjX (TVP38/TMEM64 family)